jgi:hypothetical protein
MCCALLMSGGRGRGGVYCLCMWEKARCRGIFRPSVKELRCWVLDVSWLVFLTPAYQQHVSAAVALLLYFCCCTARRSPWCRQDQPGSQHCRCVMGLKTFLIVFCSQLSVLLLYCCHCAVVLPLYCRRTACRSPWCRQDQPGAQHG